MTVSVSPRALEMIRKSLEIGNYDPAEIGVRIRVAGGAIRPVFVKAPNVGDETLVFDGITIYIDPSISGSIDLSSEHETLTIK